MAISENLFIYLLFGLTRRNYIWTNFKYCRTNA